MVPVLVCFKVSIYYLIVFLIVLLVQSTVLTVLVVMMILVLFFTEVMIVGSLRLLLFIRVTHRDGPADSVVIIV